MPANLTPQYLEAEAEYKKAQGAEERLTCLKKMWALLPKHKGTDKLQAELKAKMSDAREEIEVEKKSGKKGGISYKIPKQGAGQVIVLGGPNVGKSSLLAKLTRAQPEVAQYPFTTREPQPGMMPWEDVQVQLIDTPPITSDYMESYLTSMVRNADAAILMVDLGDDDCPFAAQGVIDQLASKKTILGGSANEEEDPGIVHTKTMLVANKVDLLDAEERLEILKEFLGDRFPIHVVSIENGTALEELRTAIYEFLTVIRVYTKKPGKPADMNSPYTCLAGSTLMELAALVHKDFAENLKSARIWGTGVYDGQSVKQDHVLHDQDIVELHA